MKTYIPFFSLTLLLFFSCDQQPSLTRPHDFPTKMADSLSYGITPNADTLNPPQTVLLDTCPKPRTIVVPEKKTGSYTSETKNGPQKIEVRPPVTIPLAIVRRGTNGEPLADQSPAGIGFFTTYTTDQGLALDAISSSLIDHFGNLWFGTYAGGVSRYDGKSFTNFTRPGKLANVVKSIAEDKSGNLWCGTYSGVSRYDGESFTNFTTAQGLANGGVGAIAEDKSGNLWFGTTGGVSRYDGKSFTNLTTAQGLANNLVFTIAEDKWGSLWFGTNGGGVSRYDGESFTNFKTVHGLANNYILSTAEDNTGNLWFGMYGGGASRYDGKSFTNFTTAQGLANNSVICIAKDKSGNLWFGTKGGVSRYDGKSFTNFTTTQGLAENAVFSIGEDRSGNLWFGTFHGGVSRYDGKSFVNFTTAQGLASNSVFSSMEDKSGNLWFGTDGGGISRYDGKSFTNFTKAQGLADNIVFSIAQDKLGNLWFATEDGLNMLSMSGQEKLAKRNKQNRKKDLEDDLFTTYTIADGLPDNFSTQVLADEGGKIYVGSNLGIAELNLSTHNGERAKAGLIFNSSTGYPVKDVNNGQHSIFKDSKGIIWIATGSDKTALVRFDPAAVRHNSGPSTVVIQSVRVNEEAISWYQLQKNESDSIVKAQQEVMTYGKLLLPGDRDSIRKKFAGIQFDSISRFYPLPQNLVLPYQKNNIGFEFAAIEPAFGNQVKYQYMLEGYDKDWSPLSNKTNANFGNINEGNYTFRLKALNPFGVWSETSYQFRILPPWYRTWWAYTIYVLLFLGALRIFSKWRERNLRSEKDKLERSVEERTNELNNTLENLKSTQSQLIQSEKMASLGELTAGIAHEIQNPLNFVNNFSEVNKELIAEMKVAIDEGNVEVVKAIANDVLENEEKINHHGKRADTIVKSMLQHSRTNKGQKEPADLNALADECLRLSYHGLRAKDKSFNTTIQTNFDKGIEKINIVPQDIARALLNIINNAFYSVNEKKKKLGDAYEPSVSVTTKKTKGQVEVRVKDNGFGIPQNIIDKIYQPFFTTKPTGQGTGLGLSLSYDVITKEHSGKIKVETTDGEGAEFIIYLPA
ncbi:MAG: two-component regulator propeller domain-containing protein [Ginsengibacter sp.]